MAVFNNGLLFFFFFFFIFLFFFFFKESSRSMSAILSTDNESVWDSCLIPIELLVNKKLSIGSLARMDLIACRLLFLMLFSPSNGF